GGSASITARGVTLRSRATSSITAPGLSAIYALRSARSVLNMSGSSSSRPPSSGRVRLALGHDDLEPLEFGVAEIEALAGLVVGTRLGRTESVRARPGVEGRLVDPHRVRGVQRVVVEHRPLQQMEFDEAGHAAEIGFAGAPDGLERGFRAELHLEAVHGDEH